MKNLALRDLYTISRWPLAFAGLALAAFLLLVYSPTLAQTPDFTLQQSISGGTTFAPGESVSVQVSVGIPASETLDSNTLRVEVVGVQTYVFNVPMDVGNVSLHQSGAALNGSVSHTGDLTKTNGGWQAATPTDDYAITFSGSFVIPEEAFPGNYTLRSRVSGVDLSPVVNTFRVEDLDGVLDPTPGPGEPSGRSPVIRMQPRNHVEIPTGIIGSLNSQVRAALGSSNASMLAGNAPLRSNESGSLVLEIPGLNLPSGQGASGSININAPQIEMSTSDGSGTATLQLGQGIVLTGDVEVTVRAAAIHFVFSDARISFSPTAPDADLITGGPADAITHLNAAFDVGITELPLNSAIELVFAKAPGEFLSNPAEVFGDAAEELGGALGSPSSDIAFIVEATRDGISNDHLGSNVVSLHVNNGWYEAREGEGKEFAILKTVNGGSYVEEASCSSGASGTMVCTAEFTGDAAGFSTFSLFAVGEPEPEPTPTPTPTVTPTPTPVTPTPTVTPPVEEEPAGNLWIIILVVVVVLAGGGAAFFFLRRRPSAEA